MSLVRSFKVLGLVAGASAALVVAPFAAGLASAGPAPSVGSVTGCLPSAVSSALNSVPVVGSAVVSATSGTCGLPSASGAPDVSGTAGGIVGQVQSALPGVPGASSLPSAPGLPGAPDVSSTVSSTVGEIQSAVSSLPGASSLPSASDLPGASSLPSVSGILGSLTGGSSGVPSASDIPVAGGVLGSVNTGGGVPSGLSLTTLPLIGGALSGALSSLPLPVSGLLAASNGTTPATGDPSSAFLDSSSMPSALPSTAAGGGSLPFTGEPGWIKLAGLAALGAAVAFGLGSTAFGFLRRRFA